MENKETKNGNIRLENGMTIQRNRSRPRGDYLTISIENGRIMMSVNIAPTRKDQGTKHRGKWLRESLKIYRQGGIEKLAELERRSSDNIEELIDEVYQAVTAADERAQETIRREKEEKVNNILDRQQRNQEIDDLLKRGYNAPEKAEGKTPVLHIYTSKELHQLAAGINRYFQGEYPYRVRDHGESDIAEWDMETSEALLDLAGEVFLGEIPTEDDEPTSPWREEWASGDWRNALERFGAILIPVL